MAELEPLGMNAGLRNPFPRTSTRPPLVEDRTYPAFANALGGQCRLDRIDVPCEQVNKETSLQCPDNDCGPQALIVTNADGEQRSILTLPFMAFSNGVSGYFLPGWAGMGTAQEQADLVRAAAVRGGRSTGMDAPRGQGQGQFANHSLPQETPLSLIEVAFLYKYADDLLKNNPDCKKFVEAVLKKVEANTKRVLKSTNVQDLFGLVYKEGGFVWGQPRIGSGAARRNIGGGRRQIMFGRSVFALPAGSPQDAIGKGIVGIHEITHLATDQPGQPYYDEDLARASWEAASDLGYNLSGKNPYPVRKENESYDAWVGRNSNFYTGMLQSVCSGVLKK